MVFPARRAAEIAILRSGCMVGYFGCFAELNLRVCLPKTDCRMRETRIIETEIRIELRAKIN